MRVKKEINVQIGEQIKAARDRAKLTQEQMAELIDVSPQFVSDLERGVVGISLSTLKRVCIELNVSSDQILFGDPVENRNIQMIEKCKVLPDKQYTILMEIIAKYLEAVDAI